MLARSHSTFVVIRHPFELKGVDRILPPGRYRVVTDEELIEELSFPAFEATKLAGMLILAVWMARHHREEVEASMAANNDG